MRKQYHFRPSRNGSYAWDVDRLVTLSASLAPKAIALDQIAELDETYWFSEGDTPSCRAIAEHFKLMMAADLQYPIILCAEGRLMDGMHRITKALAHGEQTILSVRFDQTPEPDFTDIQPHDLPY
ncbi:hypothetical protein [Hyphomonas oceanitis]|uniref:Chromosome partitioning protein ParB n=1 Tax=Hyphomonas oceanitis SCH89 TaxID=1280953 RepID=A0A059G8A9_9PROT|nr:hypothetical protein [Hyphomonas oceanitis]KDA02810.1 hypothetical protein HOC_08939 [Hyphomonas oceanitis SCH89]